MPGNTDLTIGTPSTSLGLLSIGSHTTHTDWVDFDGAAHQWLNPSGTGPPVVPAIGQRSYFSSRGPTRDGRVLPDVTAPGEFIFSSFSSHVAVGPGGFDRTHLLAGGRYSGMQGTSMASPHATGTVALMLQADPSLTPAEARQILQQTARTDGFTGTVPNVNFGAGKIDALAAVLPTLQLCGAPCGGSSGTTVAEAEPNNSPAQAQRLAGSPPVTANGQVGHADAGTLTYLCANGSTDDIEDLYRVTTVSPGLTATLGGFTQDSDLFVIDASTFVGVSNSTTPSESISLPSLPAGTYFVGVSFYDAGSETGQTPYSLVVTAALAVAAEHAPDAGGIALLPGRPNPVRDATEIGFRLPEAQDAHVAVFDVFGREVSQLVEDPHAAGDHRVRLDASGLGSGVYVVRLVAGAEVRTQTLVVAR